MFIRKTKKTDPKSSKEYFSYQLVESYRTEKGPRQTILLTIGNNIDLSDEERKILGNRIEEIVRGINRLINYPEHIESLAQNFAKQLVHKQSLPCPAPNQKSSADYHNVDVNSLENDHPREIGVEHICLETIKKLEIDLKLKQLGFTDRQIELVVGVIIGRLAGNVSELETYEWLQTTSGLDELMSSSFSHLSINTLYKVGDLLRAVKNPLEDHLKSKEADLFSLANTVALYDLTNVYCEGQAKDNPKAKKGRCKSKRTDCPLITLGVVYNPQGFPLASDIFEGNVSEPRTLEAALNRLSITLQTIVVLDAGLATEDNLKWLRDNKIRYIVCSRKRNHTIPEGLSLQTVSQKRGLSVQAACTVDEQSGETLVYCQSEAKRSSEENWKSQAQENFEKALQKLAGGLHKKRTKKDCRLILESIGRLKERYSRIAQYYQIDVQSDNESQRVTSITWTYNNEEISKRFDGGYCLRVHGLHWSCQELWDTYIMLTKAEEGFRCLKGHLGLRPVYHQKETRADSHLFITVLAYHVMQSIQYQLEQQGINLSWKKIRNCMRTHERVTTTFVTKEGKKIHIRATSNPDVFHKKIYSALKLSDKPIMKVKTIS